MLLATVLSLPFSSAAYDRDYMRHSNDPKVIDEVKKTQLSFLVVFVSDNSVSDRVIAKMRPIAKSLRGVHPTVLINCSESRSQKLCVENKVLRPPAIIMFNQDFRLAVPQRYDGELEVEPPSASDTSNGEQTSIPDSEITPGYLSEADIRQWIFENARAITDFSPAIEALRPIIDKPTRPTLIYFTPGHLMPTWMSRFCLLVHGKFRQVHQPGFDEAAWEELSGYDVQDFVKPNEYGLVLIRQDGSVTASGAHDLDEAVRWLAHGEYKTEI